MGSTETPSTSEKGIETIDLAEAARRRFGVVFEIRTKTWLAPCLGGLFAFSVLSFQVLCLARGFGYAGAFPVSEMVWVIGTTGALLCAVVLDLFPKGRLVFARRQPEIATEAHPRG